MILICPNCNARYLVDPRALGDTGRTVRCASCKHQWFATPQPEAAAAVENVATPDPKPKPIPPGSSVPAITQARRVPWTLRAGCGVFSVLSLIAAAIYFYPALIRHLPMADAVYSILGMYNTDGIVIAELAYAKEPLEITKGEGEHARIYQKDNHVIGGYLVNTTQETRKLPMMRLRLLGEDGLLIKQQMLGNDLQIEPGAKTRFHRSIDTSTDSVKRIIVEFGNPMELRLRK